MHGYASKSVSSWSERAFFDNPPRLYRYQRLIALLRAFELPLAVEQLQNGAFLAERAPRSLQFVQDELTALYQQGMLYSTPRPAEGNRYRMLYQQLFRLLHEQYRLQGFNSSWLEAGSAEAQYAILVAQRFIDSYDHSLLVPLRQMVCRLLDPADRRFSRRELIDRFGFPDVDLDEVDFEWM
jgi:hypothetical protein